jgi:hypothetical protein
VKRGQIKPGTHSALTRNPAVPLPPYQKRRAELIRRLSLPGAWFLAGQRGGYGHTRRVQENADLERMRKEGTVRIERMYRGPHGMNRSHYVLVSPPAPVPEPEVRRPYARRRAGLLELAAANPNRVLVRSSLLPPGAAP